MKATTKQVLQSLIRRRNQRGFAASNRKAIRHLILVERMARKSA